MEPDGNSTDPPFSPSTSNWEPPLEAVIFDLDGTLRHSEPRGMDLFHDLAQDHGLKLDDRTRREAVRWNHAYWADSEERAEDSETAEDREGFWLRYARRHLIALGAPPDQAEALAPKLHHHMVEHYDPVNVVPGDVIPTLDALKSQGYRLALVSNRTDPLEDTVADLDLDGRFELTLAAGEVGWWKPDPRLLRHAAEEIGVDPACAVYVGDNPYADVQGARNAGMQPVLFDPEGLFPEIECHRIAAIGELPTVLGLDAKT